MKPLLLYLKRFELLIVSLDLVEELFRALERGHLREDERTGQPTASKITRTRSMGTRHGPGFPMPSRTVTTDEFRNLPCL